MTSVVDVVGAAELRAAHMQQPCSVAEPPAHTTVDIDPPIPTQHEACGGPTAARMHIAPESKQPQESQVLLRPFSSASRIYSLPASSTGGITHAQHPPRIRYFERKRLPMLTWWCEAASAACAVFLLPLIALVPCGTSEPRDILHEVDQSPLPGVHACGPQV